MTAEEQFAFAHSDSLIFSLPQHLVYQVSGRDTQRYLHGRITQNVKALQAGCGALSLVLSPQGKIQGRFALLHRGDDFLLIVDPGSGEDRQQKFETALLQFKVADDVQLQCINEQVQLLTIIGQNAAEILAAGLELNSTQLPATEPYSHCQVNVDDLVVTISRTTRSLLPGYDLIVPVAIASRVISLLLDASPDSPSQIATEETRDMLRIAAAIPEYGIDLNEKTIATDIPVDQLVSFTKGCYSGQEVVEMSIARGRPNRRLVLLRCDSSKELAIGSAVFQQDQSQKPCGEITSSAYFPTKEHSLVLALIRNKVEASAKLYCAAGELQLFS